MTDLVSVIIPTHNRAHMVREAVDSVLAQEGVRMEIIVVDDGSTDETPEVLAPYRDRILVIRQSNRGVSAARNRGVQAARGQWIAFLDSDDLWLPGKLRAQLDFFAAHPRWLICQTEEVWIRNGRRWNPKRYHAKPSGHCFDRLLERCLISPSAVMLHRSLLEQVGLFDEDLPACEDYDLWLRIGCRHPIGLVPKPLVIKRGGHADQLSASVPALDRYRIRAIARLLKTRELSQEQRAQAIAVLQKKTRIYAQGCRKRGREDEARAVLSLASRLQT
ncbi:Glycosyl transferase family 2 [Desulfacinum hydrothermale DSM 13146]|uniref:Glycosyl transferase family 2 n=1 Tax=Desulfacinum hydrothermale DSM 13146 TaxID=1121390 RepID=A0A1W1XM75_9BACT|nr:glycosyltransferase [Desulfacinum hydrothermale]SMC25026.1 Glycosyl transferase family 2 [Desulfacinum hydrothermale DSM 13146]